MRQINKMSFYKELSRGPSLHGLFENCQPQLWWPCRDHFILIVASLTPNVYMTHAGTFVARGKGVTGTRGQILTFRKLCVNLCVVTWLPGGGCGFLSPWQNRKWTLLGQFTTVFNSLRVASAREYEALENLGQGGGATCTWRPPSRAPGPPQTLFGLAAGWKENPNLPVVHSRLSSLACHSTEAPPLTTVAENCKTVLNTLTAHQKLQPFFFAGVWLL